MNMRRYPSYGLRTTLLLSMILCILCLETTAHPVQAIPYNGSEVQTHISPLHKIQRIIVAGAPAVCKANYDQCMRGCAGAQSCSNQCMRNYNGCLQ